MRFFRWMMRMRSEYHSVPLYLCTSVLLSLALPCPVPLYPPVPSSCVLSINHVFLTSQIDNSLRAPAEGA